MFGHRIPLLKLFGFQVWIDWSWLILALLITWSLATTVFPGMAQEPIPAPTRWVMGALGALGLFVSIVLHELGHSLVARRFGVEMRGITLFIFGGVAEMNQEPPSAKAEFFIAIAGPIVSIVLGLALLGVTALGSAGDLPTTLTAVTSWLGLINLILAAFNIVPAFPLDGGRILRAILWQVKKNLREATRISSAIGAGFGVLLLSLGVLSIMLGNVVGGIWWVILGLFIRRAAQASYQQVLIRGALEGQPVSRFMSDTPVTVDAELNVHELIDRYFYTHYHKLYPVTRGGELMGCVTINAVRDLERARWDTTRVGDIARPCSDENTIAPGADAMHALEKLSRTNASRLMVVEDGRVVGIIALKDLLRFLAMKSELEAR